MKSLLRAFGYSIVFMIGLGVSPPVMSQAMVKNPNGNLIELSQEAIDNMLIAVKVAKEHNVEHLLEWIHPIMLVESRAGMVKGVGLPNAHPTRRSYGVMQVTIPTARHFLGLFPDEFKQYTKLKPIKKMSDKELVTNILNNPTANITLGIIVFKSYLEMVKGNERKAVAAYNMGIGNALKRPNSSKSHYVTLVTTWRRNTDQLTATLAASAVDADHDVAIQDTISDNDDTSLNQEKNNEEETSGTEAGQGQHSERSREAETV